jgi:hypothetical protein
MSEPFRTRTIKETLAGNLALLPEADLFLPLLERVNDSGYLPCRAAGHGVLRDLGLSSTRFLAWVKRNQRLPAAFPRPEFAVMDVSIIHEFWVESNT